MLVAATPPSRASDRIHQAHHRFVIRNALLEPPPKIVPVPIQMSREVCRRHQVRMCRGAVNASIDGASFRLVATMFGSPSFRWMTNARKRG